MRKKELASKKAPAHAAPAEAVEPLRRVHLSYAGDVNDGGFRYAATEHATRLGLTGWINRAYRGVADLVVQGPASKIRRYQKAMADSDSSGVLYNLADLEELKVVADEREFSLRSY